MYSSKGEIEAFNKIQNRYVNKFNLFSVQPLDVLDEIGKNKMSSTDRAAFDQAYELVKKAKLAKDAEAKEVSIDGI